MRYVGGLRQIDSHLFKLPTGGDGEDGSDNETVPSFGFLGTGATPFFRFSRLLLISNIRVFILFFLGFRHAGSIWDSKERDGGGVHGGNAVGASDKVDHACGYGQSGGDVAGAGDEVDHACGYGESARDIYTEQMKPFLILHSLGSLSLSFTAL